MNTTSVPIRYVSQFHQTEVTQMTDNNTQDSLYRSPDYFHQPSDSPTTSDIDHQSQNDAYDQDSDA